MTRRQTGFDVVRALGLELPDVEESTMYGAPALKVRGRLTKTTLQSLYGWR